MRLLLSACLGTLLLLVLAACQATPTPTVPESPSELQAVPTETPMPEYADDFTLTSLQGETITLSELRGEWVLVNFWATWCPPCVSEMPYLQKVSEQRGIVVLGINVQESKAQVEEFVAEHNLTFPILIDPDDRLLMFYQASSLPRTYIVAPDGTVALKIIGPIDEVRFDTWMDEHQIPFVK